MPRNRVQHQKGLSDDAFEQRYPDEEACRKAWFAWRWPEGFKCPRCAADRVFRDPEPSIAAVPAMPVPDIADRRHNPAGHQAADAGVVSRHAPARPGQEGPVQHRAGPAARDLDQRCLAGAAQADAGDARARPSLQARRRRPAHRDRRRLYRRRAHRRRVRARSPRTHALYRRDRDLLGRSAAARPPPGRARVPGRRNQTPMRRGRGRNHGRQRRRPMVSLHRRAAGYRPRAPRHRLRSQQPRATPPSAGRTPCSPMSRTASWPPTARSAPNICRATSAPSPGASTAALS